MENAGIWSKGVAENSRLCSQWTAQLTTNPGLQLGQSLNLNRPIEPLNRQTVQPSAILRRYRFPPPATEFLREQRCVGSGSRADRTEPGKNEKSKNKPRQIRCFADSPRCWIPSVTQSNAPVTPHPESNLRRVDPWRQRSVSAERPGPQHTRVDLSEKFPLRAPSIPESRAS